jgi:hypothetical protein
MYIILTMPGFSYVFDHHLWSDSGGGYSTLWDKVEPMQIPFTAMLAGMYKFTLLSLI